MDAKMTARMLILITAIYDLVLGLAFAFLHPLIFSALSIPIPEQPQYLVGGAVFIALLGVALFLAYRNMERNRDLIIFAMLFKACYVLITGYYFFIAKTAHPVFMIFAVLDIIFLIAFAMLYKKVYG